LTTPAQAVVVLDDNQFVLDFVANGDGGGSLSNLPVAVYWQWDGGTTLGIRMETPSSVDGFGNFWSFNIFNNSSSPGGIDSNGTNNTFNVISAGGALSDTSLGAFATGVDAIEAAWTQPSFDPAQPAVYIQLTMLGPSAAGGPGYRMADYLGQGGTYSNAPDFFTTGEFCGSALGTCAQLTFEAAEVAEPGTLAVLAFGLAALGWRRGRKRR